MMRDVIYALIYLVAAAALELAILPQLKPLVIDPISFIFELRLLALTGLIFGFTLGQGPALALSLGAALLFGLGFPPGVMGPTIISFGISAYWAGKLGRRLVMRGMVSRGFVLFLLLVGERAIWNLIRKFCWSDSVQSMPWLSIVATAVVASWLIGRLWPRFYARRLVLDME